MKDFRGYDRILVTGGFGFLGGHVLERLLARDGVEVHVVDDLSTSPMPLGVLLDELGQPDNLSYDICRVSDYMAGDPGRFDAILHLASVVGTAGVLRHGGRIVSSIVTDTYLLADYAMEHGARLLDVSTSEVYGGGRDGLCAERMDKIVPARVTIRSEYAVAKLAAETALLNLQATAGLDAVILRPFNIAGPRQSGEGGFVVPRFVSQAILGLPLTIIEGGRARRAFSHVGELARGVVLALDRGRAGAVYNLGSHRNLVTVEDLADLVLEVTGSSSPKQFVDGKTVFGPAWAEAADKFPAPGMGLSDLGWEPRKSVEDVVTETWRYMKSADPETFAMLAGSQILPRAGAAAA